MIAGVDVCWCCAKKEEIHRENARGREREIEGGKAACTLFCHRPEERRGEQRSSVADIFVIFVCFLCSLALSPSGVALPPLYTPNACMAGVELVVQWMGKGGHDDDAFVWVWCRVDRFFTILGHCIPSVGACFLRCQVFTLSCCSSC